MKYTGVDGLGWIVDSVWLEDLWMWWGEEIRRDEVGMEGVIGGRGEDCGAIW